MCDIVYTSPRIGICLHDISSATRICRGALAIDTCHGSLITWVLNRNSCTALVDEILTSPGGIETSVSKICSCWIDCCQAIGIINGHDRVEWRLYKVINTAIDNTKRGQFNWNGTTRKCSICTTSVLLFPKRCKGRTIFPSVTFCKEVDVHCRAIRGIILREGTQETL